jgi:hypothetical protein
MNWRLTIIIALTSCGTYVGNPKKNDDNSGTKKFAPPELEYAPPSAIATYDDSLDLNLASSNDSDFSLATNQSPEQLRLNFSILSHLKVIKKSNKLVRRIVHLEKINSEGKTSKMINSGALTVDYKVINEDGFNSAMHVCFSRENLLYMRWNDSGKRETFYNAGVPAFSKGTQESVVSKITSEVTSGGTTIKIESSGETVDSFEVVKGFRSSFVTLIKNSEFIVSQSKSVTVNGSDYLPARSLLSRFNQLSEGSFLFWERSCLPTYAVPADGAAGWCKGGDVGNESPYPSDAIRNQKAHEMLDLGAVIIPHVDLKSVQFPVACE